MSRNGAVASLKNKKQESKEVKKIAKLEEKNFETKDTIKPVIKIAYNNKTFEAPKEKEMTIEISKDSYKIKGIVTDKGGSIEKVQLRLNGRPIKLKNDGSFLIIRKSKGHEEIWLTAFDSGGNTTDLQINVRVHRGQCLRAYRGGGPMRGGRPARAGDRREQERPPRIERRGAALPLDSWIVCLPGGVCYYCLCLVF